MNYEDFVISHTVSPLTRIFDSTMPTEDFTYISGMKNEPLAFSLAYRSTAPKRDGVLSPDTPIAVRVTSTLPVSVYKVCKVSYAASECEDAGEGAVGGCPDMLLPRIAAPEIIHLPLDTKLPYYEKGQKNTLNAACFATQSVFIQVNEDGACQPAGDHTVTVEVIGLMSGSVLSSHKVTVHLVDATLPETDLILTNWFHQDCLADITHQKVYSDAYFKVLEKYLRTYVQNGMNTLLFPTFTPALDTPIGVERMNAQLVKVRVLEEGYSFDFSLAERFVRIARAAGVRIFEHTHLFSQWGAAYAITIYAEKDGEEIRLFDYKTPADSKEYIAFLDAYLSAFRDFTEAMGIENDILYHISDEPVLENIEGYRRAKSLMRSIFPNGKFADALDDYEFFKEGLVEMPIVDVRSVKNYAGRCDNFMIYYTGGSTIPNVINRLLPNAPQRTRALGYVLFGYNAKGFLHWAYNNYYGRLSNGIFHPAQDPCFYKNFPGVTYVVYPDTDGSPLPSLREKQMLAATIDYRALRLLEGLIGREETLALCESILGMQISVTAVPSDASVLLALREAVNQRIEQALR